MSEDCTQENCSFCFTCQGETVCYQQDNLPDTYIHHKCNFNCRLPKCPRCKKFKPQWYLKCHEGFCTDCAIYLFHYFSKIFPNHTTSDELYIDYMKKMCHWHNSVTT